MFAASIVVFPLFVLALRSATQCGNDTCGVVGLIAAMAFKPLAFVIFVFSFVGITTRRVRDAGVPGWVGLFIPLLLAADYTFLVFTGAPWSFGFSAGVLGIPVPRNLLLALVCIAILSMLPSRENEGRNPFGYAGWAALGLGLYIAASIALGIAAFVATTIAFGTPGAISSIVWILKLVGGPGQLVPYATVALVAVLAWIAWQGRGHVMAAPRPAHTARPGRRLPMMIVGVLAAVLTIVALQVSLPSEFALPLLMMVQFTTMVLPTFLIYFALLAALYLVATRRNAISVLLLTVALFPFAQWAYAHWTAAQERQVEAAEIAAIPTTRATRLPTTMVIDSQSAQATRAAWTIPGIERVILHGTYGSRLMEIDRPPARGASPPPRQVSSLPSEYLLLRIGQSSGFAKNRQLYAAGGGPLELRLVDPQSSELIAVWYRTFKPSPPVLPVLTLMGWYRGSNTATTDEINATVAAFLNRALTASS